MIIGGYTVVLIAFDIIGTIIHRIVLSISRKTGEFLND